MTTNQQENAMTTTTEPRTESAADQLHRCVGWIDDHGCHDACLSIHLSRLLAPTIYLEGLADLQRLFPGAKATKERSGGRWRYKVACDGIVFEAWEWIEEVREANQQEVVL
jgi:hypothetical protein